MVHEISFSSSQTQFHFLNLGETHYPYMLDPTEMPHISGVHGVFKHMGDSLGTEKVPKDVFFGTEQLQYLRDQQIRAVEYVDEVLGDLIGKAPVGTHFIVTADHGECFGEEGFFGHGPIFHSKVFEVPYLEGKKT
jgi:hypothetical protein